LNEVHYFPKLLIYNNILIEHRFIGSDANTQSNQKNNRMKLIIICLLTVFSAISLVGQDSLNLPPLLQFDNGKPVKNIKDWNKRSKQILKVFQEELYGIAPPVPRNVKYTVEMEDADVFNGKATKKRINLYLKNLGHPIELLIYYPNNGNKKTPVFLGYNFFGNYTIINDSEIPLTKQWVRNVESIKNNKASEELRGFKSYRWPVEQIIDAGYALVTLYYGDIDPDYDPGFKNGVHALYNNPKYTWGSISAWAWGLSYVMNYIEVDKNLDSKKVAVIGHSRLGKTALWAGANDKRFAMVISNNSGCTGAALSRRKVGERFDILIRIRSYWYAPNFSKYDNKEEELVVDQHQLIALVAPRPVYVASADKDLNADPEGEFLGLYYGSEVYQLFNMKGLEDKQMPKVNTPIISGQAGYHLREGKHEITAYDWTQYLKFADLHFKE
jgi:hypothetical protein